ncbi:MAG: c-type cytochrome [Vicinamibacterales bacterium]
MRKALGILVLFAAGVAWPSAAFSQDATLARGKYLVEEVARCQECHTPRTETGELDKTKWMKGATIIGVPPTPVADWHQRSPDISSTSALWTRWGQDGLTTFLQTAKNPRGGKAGPPMPAYTMKKEDAEAIVAYLKTLP